MGWIPRVWRYFSQSFRPFAAFHHNQDRCHGGFLKMGRFNNQDRWHDDLGYLHFRKPPHGPVVPWIPLDTPRGVASQVYTLTSDSHRQSVPQLYLGVQLDTTRRSPRQHVRQLWRGRTLTQVHRMHVLYYIYVCVILKCYIKYVIFYII